MSGVEDDSDFWLEIDLHVTAFGLYKTFQMCEVKHPCLPNICYFAYFSVCLCVYMCISTM